VYIKNEFYNLELFGRSHKSGEEQKLIKHLYPKMRAPIREARNL